MDVILPGHHIRLFCASLVCASRVGKDLYVEFDSASGLVLRTLNDAKSAYVCFRYQPHFFQRCTTSSTSSSSSLYHRRKRSRTTSTTTTTSNSNSNHNHNNGRRSQQQQQQQQQSPSSSGGSVLSPSSQNEKFICRVPLRALAAVVRQRKNELSLRIQSERTSHGTRKNHDNDQDDDDDDEMATMAGTLCLTFEFQWQATLSSSNHTTTTTATDAPLLKVLHRIPVAAVSRVSAAVARREDASEFQTHPSVLLRLLDPLKRTAEAALIIRADISRIHASSFHQSPNHPNNTNNAILQSNSDSLLKTETGIGCDELQDFFFRQDRNPNNNQEEMPLNVNQQVILVFPIKEAKAFLLFASSSNNNNNNPVDVFFHWGGKPIVWQIQQQQQLEPAELEAPTTSSWKAELILATLDHDLLGGSSIGNDN